ncbi:MAG TPA: uroporphyrinogen decarboxylase [Bacteroidia bacterium]|nr:uroporphyrinogen decarboxylase [Bacteroidia bacterium]HNU33262.1 uroporphyrinogen decarboxylase [Bacteroidia bacterium]
MSTAKALKNNLLLKVLNGEHTERVPVWMMRQAGRYLPEYMVLKNKYSFFERVKNPELACEITLQPIDIIGTDAAIIFSDILVVPEAMGLEVQMVENKGPLLPSPIKSENDLKRITVPDVKDKLYYMAASLSLTKKELNNRVPLIGFAGAPFTILCYMVQGKGSKGFEEAKAFCYSQPDTAKKLLQMITDTTISYLEMQIESGADCVQVFDSWAGVLSADDFKIWALPYIKQISERVSAKAPVIVFAKGAWYGLEEMSKIKASALGVDWCIEPKFARQLAGNNITLQGNFDPSKLLSPIPEIRNEVKKMMAAFGKHHYIANLGHGILPHVPVSHAKAFVDAVKEFGVNS